LTDADPLCAGWQFTVDHVTVFQWDRRSPPSSSTPPCRHATRPAIAADELIRALRDAAAGDTILFDSPDYTVGVPLSVPDGVTLKGAGVMQVLGGLPDQLGTPTTIKAGPGLRGNLITLGNKCSLRGLVLWGPSEALEDGAGRGGNTVAVASRGKNDVVSATIVECELHNQIESASATDGPTGGAILVYTRKPPPRRRSRATRAREGHSYADIVYCSHS
jgi:hypothetical protein